MERLSIDEVIDHCKRHTDEVEKRISKAILEMGDMDYPAMKKYWEHRQVAEWLEQLKSYKDAEEQGLLLRLKLNVGDTFWELNSACSEPYIYPRIAHSLMHVMYCMDNLGKITFLTEEAAKEALEKMKGGTK